MTEEKARNGIPNASSADTLNQGLFIRYEFDGTGIFHALKILYDCDMERADEEELEEAEYILNKDLVCPCIDWQKIPDSRCWFSEDGVKAFKEELDTLMCLFHKYLEDAGIGELRIVRKKIPEQNIIYRDNFQVVAVHT